MHSNAIYGKIFAPVLFKLLSPLLSEGEIYVPNNISVNATESGRIQDGEKKLVPVKERTLHGAKLTLYTVHVSQIEAL